VLNVQWKTPDDGQRGCPKYVDFYDRIIFGKLVLLVGLFKRKLSCTPSLTSALD
jgi:hypothetical protein